MTSKTDDINVSARAAFEAWALPQALPINNTNGHYDWYDVRMRWEGFQAGHAAALADRAERAVPAATMKRIDAAAEAMSEVMAHIDLKERGQKFERALSGLRAIQANAAATKEAP